MPLGGGVGIFDGALVVGVAVGRLVVGDGVGTVVGKAVVGRALGISVGSAEGPGEGARVGLKVTSCTPAPEMAARP